MSEFDKGYVCAVANLLRLHDEPTLARDILNENPPSDHDWWNEIDESDRTIILLNFDWPPKKEERNQMRINVIQYLQEGGEVMK